MVDIVEAIQKGMNGRYLFHDPSFSEPIQYRAITRYEHELARISALEEAPENIVEVLTDWASFKIEPIEKEELTKEELIELAKYYFNLSVNIVYQGTKDFQGADYSIQSILDSFIDITELAKAILHASTRKPEEVVEVVKSTEGHNLLTIHYVLGVPLASEAWRLTPLQVEFLIEGKKPKAEAKGITQEDLDKDPEGAKKRLMAMFNVPTN